MNMASIRRDISVAVDPAEVWDAVRDFGALHERFVKGFVTSARLDGDTRTLAFANGAVAKERYCTPLPVDSEPGQCPGCHQPFEESSDTVSDRLVCPHCGGRGTFLDGFDCRCQMLRGEPGLA